MPPNPPAALPDRSTGFPRPALALVPLVLLLGMGAGWVSGNGADNRWFAALVKPALYPPPLAFPIVWAGLFVLIGTALAYVVAAPPSAARTRAIIAFVVQFALNLAWSPVFFAARQLTWGLAVILALVVALVTTIVLFARVDRRAAWLLAPYLGWSLFATGLNWQLLVDNPPADGAPGPAAVSTAGGERASAT